MKGLGDRALFVSASEQRRAIVTRDLADFRPLVGDAIRRGTTTYGLICVPRRFSLASKDADSLVRALEALLTSRPEDDAAVRLGGEVWLSDPAEPERGPG